MGWLGTRVSLVLMTAVICADLPAITCLLGCDHAPRQARGEQSAHPCHEGARPPDGETRLTSVPAGCHGAGEVLDAVLPRARAAEASRDAGLAVHAVSCFLPVNLAPGDAAIAAGPPPSPAARRPLASLRL